MVMFCAAWTLVDRRTQPRYDRIMEFVVAVVVWRKQCVSLALATLEVKFESERCDLLSFGDVHLWTMRKRYNQRPRPIVTNGVPSSRTLLQTLLCIRIQMTCRTPRREYHNPPMRPTRQRIVTTLVGAHNRKRPARARCASNIECCIHIGQLHTLGDSAQFSPVEGVSRQRVVAQQSACQP